MCETLLNQFLKTIRADPTLGNIPAMTNVLIGHAQASNELIQATAIRWISEFVHLSGSSMLPYTSGILTAILPCLAYENEAKRREYGITRLGASFLYHPLFSASQQVANVPRW